MNDNGDPCAGHHGGADTSVAAWASVDGETRATQRARVYSSIMRADDGATCDELEVLLDMAHQTCSARITELRKAGLILDTGRRRETRTKRTARVYSVEEV